MMEHDVGLLCRRLRLRRADEPRHGGQQQPGGDPAEQPREICASSSGTSSLMV